MSENILKKLDEIPLEIITAFRKTGNSEMLSKKTQEYIIRLDKAAEVQHFEPNITRAAKTLRTYPECCTLSFSECRDLIYDAINYFHINSTVKNEAWDNYYADRLEDLFLVAIKSKNITEARRCLERAHNWRTNRDENAINPEDLKVKDQLISPDITAARLHIEEFNLHNLWREGKNMINKFDISDKEKSKILTEFSNTIDVDYDDCSD